VKSEILIMRVKEIFVARKSFVHGKQNAVAIDTLQIV